MVLHTVQQGGRDLYTEGLFPSASFSSRTMAQTAPTDPTKMGEGRAIAVLTSGGDAQGKWRVFEGGMRAWSAKAGHVCPVCLSRQVVVRIWCVGSHYIVTPQQGS